MNRLSYILLSLGFSFSSFAQNRDSTKDAKIVKDKSDGLNFTPFHQYSMDDKKPEIVYTNENKLENLVLFLDGNEASFEIVKTLDPNIIESISIIKGNQVHGMEDKDKILVTTKSGHKVKLMSMSDLIKKYSLPNDERILISIDDEIIDENFEKLYVDESHIMQVKVSFLNRIEKEHVWVYLKILTRNAVNVKKANEILVR